MTDPLSLIPQSAFKVKPGDGKFKPKLEFDERCAILALCVCDVDRRVIAVAYGVDRRTVAHIHNKHSVHYKDVRKQLLMLGRKEFVTKYLTEEVAHKVAAAHGDPATLKSDDDLRESSGAKTPSARANKKEGINVVKPEQCAYSHRLEIRYFSAGVQGNETEAGWYYRDLDSQSSPDVYYHNGEASLMTSNDCLRHAEMNLTDD